MTDMVWWKSTRCGSGQCLDAARARGRILVRDSRGAASPVLEFSPVAWREFVDGLRR